MAKKILVIDDEVYIRDSITGFLEDFGFEVIEAENGRIGLEKFESQHPDLVLCDLRMPELDGLDVLASITRHSTNTPVIIVSGAGNISDTVDALHLGAWDYIIKPIQEMNMLYHAVNKAFERKRLIQEKDRYQRVLEDTNKELKISLQTLEKTRDQLANCQQMAALGELVAGVTHDIHIPVEEGVTAASLLATRTREFKRIYTFQDPRHSELGNYLATVEEVSNSILMNIERAAKQVSSFKQMALDQSCEEQRRFNLREYLNDILLILGSGYNLKSYAVHVDCEADIELNSFPGVFFQILNNMIMHSLTHGFKDMKNGRIDIGITRKEKQLVLIYKDNGKGMNLDQKEKIFDPSSSMEGKCGIGKGMFTVYNLVTQTLKGTISLETARDKGVVFTITIPKNREK